MIFDVYTLISYHRIMIAFHTELEDLQKLILHQPNQEEHFFSMNLQAKG